MSTCISRHGEYGSHLPGEDRFICDRCFVFDEDAAMAALVATETQLAAAQAQLAEALSNDETRHKILETNREMRKAAEARLEAVRVGIELHRRNFVEKAWSDANLSGASAEALRDVETQAQTDWQAAWPWFDAALSAAPQPEPDDGCAECTESGTRNCVAGCKPEPPAIDEPTGRSD